MELLRDLLDNQGGVAAGAVIDDEIHLEPIIKGRVYDLGSILNHLRVQHSWDQLVKGEGLGM